MKAIAPTREFALLAGCCQAAFPARRRAALEATPETGIETGIDWARFRRLARFHRVQGLAWKGIGRLRLAVPEAVAESMAQDARSIAATNLRIAAECKALLGAFEEAGVSVLFVKGLTLAALAYDDIAAKAGVDVDVLVDPGALQRSAGILASLGYTLVEPGPGVSLDRLVAWHGPGKESAWTNPSSGLQIDLHTRLADNHRLIPAIGLNSPRQAVAIPGIAALPTLGDEALFAYLAVHGASSAWFRLKWLADFAAFAEHLGLDSLDHFYRRSIALGAGRAPALALLLADRLFGTLALSPDLAEELGGEWTNRWLERLAFAQLAGKSEPVEPTGSRLGTMAIHLTQFGVGRGGGFMLSELHRQAQAALRPAAHKR